MKIPFSPPYIDEDIIKEVSDVLRSGWITTGPKVLELQSLIRDITQSQQVLCVNSATSGLMLALKWFGIKSGDEVIIPAYTYAATALAVMHVGATPIMVDCNEDFNISIDAIQQKLTSKTKCIIPVDIGGWPCDYNEILQLLDQWDGFTPANEIQKKLGRPFILADSAHSVGALYDNKRIGSIADVTVMSFHAVKNITTAEGGAICIQLPESFNAEEEFKLLKLMSLNGQTKDALEKTNLGSWKYDIVLPGFKINMPDVLAAIGLTQLKNYTYLLEERRRVFDAYSSGFGQYDQYIIPKARDAKSESSYHLFPLRIKGITELQRDKMINWISEKGVSVNVHFTPLPMLSLFSSKGYDISDYPSAYQQYSTEISLPIYPQLSQEEIAYVIKAVTESYNRLMNDETI